MKPIDRRLLRASRPARLHLLATGVLAVLQAVVIVAQAALLAHIITDGVSGAGLGAVSGLLIMLAAVVTMRALIDGGFDALGRFGATRVMSELRGRLAEHLLLRRPGIDGRARTGELAALAIQGIDAVEPYFARFLPQLALAATVPAVILIWLLPHDLLSAAIMAATLPMIPFFMWLVGVATQRQTDRRWRALSLLSAHFLDVVRGLTTLRAHVREGVQLDSLSAVGDRYRRETMGTLRIAFLSAFVLELIAMIAVALIAGTVGVRLAQGHIDLYSGLVVLLLAPELYLPWRQVGAQFHASADGLETADALQRALAEPPAVEERRPQAIATAATNGSLRAPDPAREPIVLRGVGYRYPGREIDVLDGVDLTFEPTLTTALVGPSGAGKSTIAALVTRLADPVRGGVFCGQRDLREIAVEDWRARCAYVPQRARLYSGTIAENLRMGRPTAGNDRLWDALLAAAAIDLVRSLPDGLDTIVGEGGRRLSAGEEQRLAIARAFVRDAPLLVLDEPSAHLDEETAAAIDSSLDRLRRGRTTLLIAHRPAMAARADRVFHIDDGHLSGPPLRQQVAL